MVVTMMSYVLHDIMLCSPVKVNWHFRGTYCLNFQGQRIIHLSIPTGVLLGLLIDPEDGCAKFL
jgi:hypothetical protein